MGLDMVPSPVLLQKRIRLIMCPIFEYTVRSVTSEMNNVSPLP